MSSTSVFSSASNATVSIFDTVANTALTTTKLINSIGTGVNMFDRMMNDMDKNHEMRSIINQHGYEKMLLETAAKETANRQDAIRKEMQGNPEFHKLFKENYEELQTLLHPIKPE